MEQIGEARPFGIVSDPAAGEALDRVAHLAPEVVVAQNRSGAADDETLARDVIETCRGRLADFKVPRAVYFVDEFPLGTLDKILKNKLREMADAHPPA